jgi:IclR family mhp operon transcriptional activator
VATDEYAGDVGKRGTIRSISRGLAVLQAINRAGSLTMMDISVFSGVPYPTASRIVQTLLADGMIEREPFRKRYRPTALVQTLSAGYQIENQLVVSARPYIVALTNEFTWPISVSTRVGTSMMVRDSTHAMTPLTFHLYHPGYTLPMLESSSGRTYMAFCSEHERQTVIRGLNASRRLAKNAEPRWDEFSRMMEQIRQNGYATHNRTKHNENPGKTSSISVPVFASGHLVGTLTLIFFASAMTMEDATARFVDALQTAARNLSNDLTARQGEPIGEASSAS